MTRHHGRPTETLHLDASELRADDFVWQTPVSDSYRVESVRPAAGRIVAVVVRPLGRPEVIRLRPAERLRVVREPRPSCSDLVDARERAGVPLATHRGRVRIVP